MIRDLNIVQDDISRKKRVIEEMLYSDPDIIEMLDSSYADCPDEIMYENIFPFVRVPDTQDEAKSYICFAIDDLDVTSGNSVMKNQYVKFVVFVQKDLIKTQYNIPRHDLLGYLIKDIFHLSNNLGMQMEIVSSREGVTDTNYYTRTLQFNITTPNSMQPFKTSQYERKSIVGKQDKVVQREPV